MTFVFMLFQYNGYSIEFASPLYSNLRDEFGCELKIEAVKLSCCWRQELFL